MRPLEEAFLRLFLAMSGTDKQASALWNGTYKTEFAVVWAKIYERIGLDPNIGPWLKVKIRALHGFTHGGKEQLVRQAKGSEIGSSYEDDEIRALARESLTIAFLSALFATAFLGYRDDHQRAIQMMNDLPVLLGES